MGLFSHQFPSIPTCSSKTMWDKEYLNAEKQFPNLEPFLHSYPYCIPTVESLMPNGCGKPVIKYIHQYLPSSALGTQSRSKLLFFLIAGNDKGSSVCLELIVKLIFKACITPTEKQQHFDLNKHHIRCLFIWYEFSLILLLFPIHLPFHSSSSVDDSTPTYFLQMKLRSTPMCQFNVREN